MKTLNIAEYKLQILQRIISLNNIELIEKLNTLIDNFLSEKYSGDSTTKIEFYNEEDKPDNLTFEEWNDKYMQNRDLEEYIPEYGMTLKDYRMKIYKSEQSESFPIEKFYEKLERYGQKA